MNAALMIVRAPPGASIQDGGRHGFLHAGVPPSGPLDSVAHAAANLSAGNPALAAAIEIPLGALVVQARGTVTVSVDGDPRVELRDGELFTVPACGRAVRYLAIAGAIDVPLVLGSRATLVVAGMGGHQGRHLRANDQLPVGGSAPLPSGAGPTVIEPAHPAVLRVGRGPHRQRFPDDAFDVLRSADWRVSPRSDGTVSASKERAFRGSTRTAPPQVRWSGRRPNRDRRQPYRAGSGSSGHGRLSRLSGARSGLSIAARPIASGASHPLRHCGRRQLIAVHNQVADLFR